MSVPQEVKLARHAGDLDDDGHEIITDSVTTETDTSLRLAPDGAGGVEFAAGAGGSGLTVQDEGTPLATDATTLNFTGAGVTASGSGATKTINIPGSGPGATIWVPLMVDSPNIVTVTGEAVWVQFCTADGVPILIEVSV